MYSKSKILCLVLGATVLACLVACSKRPQLTEEQRRCANLPEDGSVSSSVYWDCIKTLPPEMRARLCTLPGENKLFVASPECYETLPQVTISGYWLHGFEHSAFARNLDDLKFDPKGPSGAWLELSEEAERSVPPTPKYGHLRLYRVEFVGAESKGPGSYQYAYRTGAYVHGFTNIEEIPLSVVDPK